MQKRSSNPKDINRLAACIVQDATQAPAEAAQKNPAAVALGRLGGLKGGRARAAKLSAEKSKEIAKNAAEARWRVRRG